MRNDFVFFYSGSNTYSRPFGAWKSKNGEARRLHTEPPALAATTMVIDIISSSPRQRSAGVELVAVVDSGLEQVAMAAGL